MHLIANVVLDIQGPTHNLSNGFSFAIRRLLQPLRGYAATTAIAEARLLAGGVKAAIDNGGLNEAELFLVEARQALGVPTRKAEHEIALTLALEAATIAQYRGDSDRAWELADAAVEFADESFGPRGIHVARARLRRNFAMEARRDFSRARRANLELADELVRVVGSDALRLNCYTRAIACSVKNADRSHLPAIGSKAEPLWQKLRTSGGHEISRWFLYWCAIASLRQLHVDDAAALIDAATRIGPTHWRWNNAAQFARGHGMTLLPGSRRKGQETLESARHDAEQRGFYGLIRSIDAGLTG
jgi:hypothetical protein